MLGVPVVLTVFYTLEPAALMQISIQFILFSVVSGAFIVLNMFTTITLMSSGNQFEMFLCSAASFPIALVALLTGGVGFIAFTTYLGSRFVLTLSFTLLKKRELG